MSYVRGALSPECVMPAMFPHSVLGRNVGHLWGWAGRSSHPLLQVLHSSCMLWVVLEQLASRQQWVDGLDCALILPSLTFLAERRC